jgi:hypothetical protein
MRIGPERVGLKCTEYPEALESILKSLTLFKWEQTPLGWAAASSGFTFDIPLIFQVSESLLAPPMSIPHIRPLETFLTSSVEDPNEPVERPAYRFALKSRETAKFKRVITDVKNTLDNLKIEEIDEWRFFDIAQSFLLKAFFSEGLEQLLWHITVIEALLGEKGEGITDRLANRIVTILGGTERERQKIRKIFKEDLYEFRSALVHGRKFKKEKETDTDHLYSARELARRTLYWFLHYLDTIQSGISEGQLNGKIPSREDLLTLIDLDDKGRKHMRWMVDKMPKEFPNVPEWKDQ